MYAIHKSYRHYTSRCKKVEPAANDGVSEQTRPSELQEYAHITHA